MPHKQATASTEPQGPDRFYHAFPRRRGDKSQIVAEDLDKGLAILRSLCERGFLLVPEILAIAEPLADGTSSMPWLIGQKRICFTHLQPGELPAHASTFGPFALEYGEAELRRLGGHPVFYLPLQGEGLGGPARTLIARLGEVLQTMDRLAEMQSLAGSEALDSETINCTLDGDVIGPTRCTVGGLKDVLAILGQRSRPWSELAGALRALSAFTYPTERPWGDSLEFYRQREWRIVSGIVQLGIELDRVPTDEEVAGLLNIDPEFFGKEMTFRSGTEPRARQSRLMSTVDDRHVLDYATSIIVPGEVIAEAERVVREAGFADLPVQAIGDVIP